MQSSFFSVILKEYSFGLECGDNYDIINTRFTQLDAKGVYIAFPLSIC